MSETGTLIGARRLQALDRTDAMRPELRAVVHEIGLPIVEQFITAGVRDPAQMRAIARMFWTASSGQENGKVGVMKHLDVMVARAGGVPNSDALAVLLASSNMVILPMRPSRDMVRASITELAYHGTVSHEEKHRLRLTAAIAWGAKEYWPRVFGRA